MSCGSQPEPPGTIKRPVEKRGSQQILDFLHQSAPYHSKIVIVSVRSETQLLQKMSKGPWKPYHVEWGCEPKTVLLP
jgi:hypothetical protein